MCILKQYEATQKKVQRQLLKLQGLARSALPKTGKKLKSGLHRAGDNAVKLEIPWPHHHYFPNAGETFQSIRIYLPSNLSLDSWVASKRSKVI